ncbi:MAG: Asp-tRNA(Asn)/Glu-tRNA(Gln) amidotransferase subunit GatA [Deltaproteobacteria bacterium]|nr:MAG: Asp-tRNA(Asn)/Glu-tRNA(Gln) amidotransferase subunit GatA [Deltaproteobacteria bacterium]
MNTFATAGELLAALDAGEVTSVALTEAALARARAGAELGAWLHLAEEQALTRAADVDRRRAAGEPVGALAGVPIGVKDQIVTRGIPTTAGSKMLAGWVPPYDATVVERLHAADAIVVGKLNQDEFAMGSSNERSAFGPVRNPWDPSRVPGGSSGGSAAAVAAGHVPLALGTDTGGSIRQPASFCGVVGLKPTYGRVSRYGAIAFASSLDQIGPFGRTVADVARLMGVLAGPDDHDSTALRSPVPDYLAGLGGDLAGLRVGVPEEYFVAGIDPEVEATVRAALAQLEAQGATLVPVSLPHTPYAVATYYILATAEASSNLARYDGVRFGHRTAERVSDVADLYAKSRAEGFGDEVKRRIILGTYALSSGYYDAYYLKAQKVRTLLRRDFEAAFAACDVLATPVSPVTAFRLGERVDDPLQMYLADIFTIPSSLAGNTSVSVPCGFDGAGLPVGLQLIGPPLEEGRVLRVAHAYEQATAWHRRHPGEEGA